MNKLLLIITGMIIIGIIIFILCKIYISNKLIQTGINKIESVSAYNYEQRQWLKKTVANKDDIAKIITFFNTLEYEREATDDDFPEGSHSMPFLFKLKNGKYFILEYWLIDHIDGSGTVIDDDDNKRYVVASSGILELWSDLDYNEVHLTYKELMKEVIGLRKHDLIGINSEIFNIMNNKTLND
jgi:hypothetical protein